MYVHDLICQNVNSDNHCFCYDCLRNKRQQMFNEKIITGISNALF